MLNFKVKGFDKTKLALDHLEKDFQDYSPFFQDKGVDIIKKVVAEIFESEGQTHRTSRWPPLKRRTRIQKAKRYPGKKILRRTDRYYHSLTSRPVVTITAKRFSYGTNVPYSVYLEPTRPVLTSAATILPEILRSGMEKYLGSKIRGC